MCGIAGRFSPDAALSEDTRFEVERMTQQLRHRGPDAGGLLDSAPIAVLGHRRLSIIDLAQGQQPMSYRDGSLWITYNGEIYNYRELRAQLNAKGHTFRTNSDTEVVLAAYAEWGEECVEFFEGMFAFAVLDVPEKRLFLARDHLGKKPLYFRWRNRTFDFASELSALRHASDWRDDFDPLGWAFYLRLSYIPSPWTAYRGVEKLRPGERCVVDRRGVRRYRYWEPRSNSVESGSDLRRAADELASLLGEAVRMRLVSDVPLGAFLSGGIDSGLVVGLMAELCGPGVKTSTVGFSDEPGGGEMATARAVAEHHHTDHAEITVHADATAVVGPMMDHFGEPFGDASAVPMWYISRATRDRVTVALTGDGGDEPFGGYDFRYLPHRRDARLRQLLPDVVRRSLFGHLERMWPARHSLSRSLRLRSAFRNLAVSEDEAFYLDLCFTPPDVAAALAPDLAVYGRDVEDHVRSIYRSSGSSDPLESIMLADVKLYMTEDVLVKVDRMSMAHGLEVRCPLLSRRIVDLAFSIPSAMKIQGHTTKLILRALSERYLPARIAALPKRGFHVPLDHWFRTGLRNAFESAIVGRGKLNLPWVNSAGIASVWQQHQQGRFNYGNTLWAVWALAAWMNELEHCKLNPRAEPPSDTAVDDAVGVRWDPNGMGRSRTT
jgi:asparagine synthase (glutamine-hydrolysing)